jgi:hypothetical protein
MHFCIIVQLVRRLATGKRCYQAFGLPWRFAGRSAEPIPRSSSVAAEIGPKPFGQGRRRRPSAAAAAAAVVAAGG